MCRRFIQTFSNAFPPSPLRFFLTASQFPLHTHTHTHTHTKERGSLFYHPSTGIRDWKWWNDAVVCELCVCVCFFTSHSESKQFYAEHYSPVSSPALNDMIAPCDDDKQTQPAVFKGGGACANHTPFTKTHTHTLMKSWEYSLNLTCITQIQSNYQIQHKSLNKPRHYYSDYVCRKIWNFAFM